MPRPRRSWPATGSWSARASTGPPRSPPGCRSAPARSRSPRGHTRTCGRSPSPRPSWSSDPSMPATEVEDLLRQLAPQVLGALVRRYGHFDTAEDAVQEALLAAATQWPAEGIPGNPRRWLITVASRRLTTLLRADPARQRPPAATARPAPPP